MKYQTILGAALLSGLLGAAHAELVVIGAPAAAALTKEQVADVYLGKSNAATPVDLPEGNPLRGEFYTKATGRDAAQVKATWSRLVFTGKGQPPKEYPDAAAVKKAVAEIGRAHV